MVDLRDERPLSQRTEVVFEINLELVGNLREENAALRGKLGKVKEEKVEIEVKNKYTHTRTTQTASNVKKEPEK